jgi:hypothetical protein
MQYRIEHSNASALEMNAAGMKAYQAVTFHCMPKRGMQVQFTCHRRHNL